MNFELHSNSKEAIKARMLQNAAKLWGVRNVQVLDPFVKLLVDAFSTEVFKSNNEIQNISSRILEKLARLLTPSRYAHPVPAHAVAFCQPEEDRELLPEHSEFFLKKQITSFTKSQSDRQVEISMTPVNTVELINAQVAVMICGNTIYQIEDSLTKIPIARFEPKAEAFRTMKIGIDFSRYKTENYPKSLSFFTTNPTFEHIDFIYRLLPFVKITAGNTELSVKSGINYEEEIQKQGFESIIEEQSIRRKIANDIRNIYDKRFIEISGLTQEVFQQMENTVPEEIHSENAALSSFRNKKMLWLTLEFPPQFTSEMLSGFLFVINAFPVYNRSWKKTEYALDIMGNNIPLETTEVEHMLYVDEVMDGHGKRYSEIPFTPTDIIDKGLYTVRRGGMEKFSSRNSTNMLAYVLELFRDEVAAFSIINRDKVKDSLADITEKMKLLQKKVELADRELKEDIHYIIIEPLENSAHTFASYWVTNCTLANGIRPGTLFHSQKKAQSITLITETLGGAEEQKQSDTILAYRYALTTRDKIVSAEDIKSYCRLMLKEQLKSIEISRGTMVSDRPKEGFVRTVDVNITARDYDFYGQKYWENMAGVLKNHITERAIDGIEYRVKIKNEVLSA